MRGWFAIPRFRGTPKKRHETCQFIPVSLFNEAVGCLQYYSSSYWNIARTKVQITGGRMDCVTASYAEVAGSWPDIG